jgi:hypothetical protein
MVVVAVAHDQTVLLEELKQMQQEQMVVLAVEAQITMELDKLVVLVTRLPRPHRKAIMVEMAAAPLV